MAPQTLNSMTGFGRAAGEISERLAVSIVIRGVNHRYLDIQVRTNLREDIPEVEAALRKVVSRRINRGRVNVQVNLKRTLPDATSILVNPDAISSVLEQLEALDDAGNKTRTVAIGDILNLPGVVTVNSDELLLDDSEMAALEALGKDATAAFADMRQGEAKSLKVQIDDEIAALREFIGWFMPQMDGFRDRLFTRLKERLLTIVGTEVAIDEDRLVQEAALATDRADVAEEIVRLESHLETFENRISKGGTIGRALDFLCQEINRELNTLGSKCRELGIAERLVEAKSATERIREQVQNLE